MNRKYITKPLKIQVLLKNHHLRETPHVTAKSNHSERPIELATN